MQSEHVAANRIVPGWIIVRQPDGTLVMRESQEKRRQSSMGCLIFSLIWTGMIAFFAATILGYVPGEIEFEGIGSGERGLVPLILPAVIGLYGIYSSLANRNMRQEWVAGPNYLDLRWGGLGSDRMKSRRYLDGTLEISHTNDKEDGPQTSLSFHAAGGWLNQGALLGTRLNGCTPAQIREVAELVAQTTGWPLTITGTPVEEEVVRN